MDLRSDFAYAWDLTKAGIHAALLKKIKSGEVITPEAANRAMKIEKLCWKDEARVQHAFLLKLERERPQQAEQFWKTLDGFSFWSIQQENPKNAIYLAGIAAAVLLGFVLGWFMPAGWILPTLIGRTLTIVVAVLVFGGMGASLCLGMLKNGQEEQKKKQLEQYMDQLEELRKQLSELCG